MEPSVGSFLPSPLGVKRDRIRRPSQRALLHGAAGGWETPAKNAPETPLKSAPSKAVEDKGEEGFSRCKTPLGTGRPWLLHAVLGEAKGSQGWVLWGGAPALPAQTSALNLGTKANLQWVWSHLRHSHELALPLG